MHGRNQQVGVLHYYYKSWFSIAYDDDVTLENKVRFHTTENRGLVYLTEGNDFIPHVELRFDSVRKFLFTPEFETHVNKTMK